jgi:Potassium-transporting ATPase A subunit
MRTIEGSGTGGERGRRRLGLRQREEKRDAPLGEVLGPDASTVGPDDPLADRQAKTGATTGGGLPAIELLEDPVLLRQTQAEGRLVAMTGDGTNDAPALAQADVAVAMNSGTQAAKEAGNMIDLDSNPTKLLEVVETGKQMLMTRGALTTFSIANDVAKYFAIIPAAFASTYPVAMLLFNFAGLLVVYLLQRLQGVLPFNPQALGAVSTDSSFNTAVSFATNTNWQGYGGETTMSYLTQMLGLTVQNFVSAAAGMATLVALRSSSPSLPWAELRPADRSTARASRAGGPGRMAGSGRREPYRGPAAWPRRSERSGKRRAERSRSRS